MGKKDTISVKSEVKSIAIYERRIYLRMEKFTKPPIYGIFMHLADENVDMGMPGYIEIRKVKNGYAINKKYNVYNTLEKGLESYLKEYLKKMSDAYWLAFVEEGKVQLFIDMVKSFLDDEFLSDRFSL